MQATSRPGMSPPASMNAGSMNSWRAHSRSTKSRIAGRLAGRLLAVQVPATAHDYRALEPKGPLASCASPRRRSGSGASPGDLDPGRDVGRFEVGATYGGPCVEYSWPGGGEVCH